jgi:DNA repair protein RecN (Recombination protein N)
MLANLTIKNVVLIEHLSIDFKNGLCVLTGETGAGKSILLDSLGLVLGARSDSSLLRRGQEKASVTAVFELEKGHDVLTALSEEDMDLDGEDLILRRIITKDGRSKAYINDQAVSVSLLKNIGEMLIEIHGQFDTHSILYPQNHIHLLDEFGGYKDKIDDVAKSWSLWASKRKELKTLQENIERQRNDEEFFQQSLEDLDALAPEQGEEEKLTQLRQRLQHREQILDSLNRASSDLEQMEEISGSLWRSLDKLNDTGSEAIAAMERVNAEMQEVAAALQDISQDIENAEYSLEEIDDRLFALKAQAKKHSCLIDELPAKREEIAATLNSIENQDEILSKLIKDVEKKKENYFKEAKMLSSERKKSADKLMTSVMKELPPLKLDKARFEIEQKVLEEENWSERGIDQIRFLVATNPGSDAGPIHKIASGGEMSRFMLALKVALAETVDNSSLVFDEVDSGVGGSTAAAVGQRLAALAQNRQVLVVTHSPQVAAQAQYHWIVSKGGEDVVTTNIIPLFELQQRQEEIARMISGENVTEEARAAAGKLLEASAA